MRQPTHGFTRNNQPVHAKTTDHHPDDSAYARLNKRVAIVLTSSVGTMTCFWAFCVLALVSFPAAISSGSVLVIVAWTAQTFIQLVLLPALMVGQNLQTAAADVRAAKTFEDVEWVMNQVNERTEGGLRLVLDRLDKINTHLGMS